MSRLGVSTQTAPSKRSASRTVEPDLLGAGHRVPTDEAGVVDRVDDLVLHAADVGDHAAGHASRTSRTSSTIDPTGVATNDQLGVGVAARGVERAERDGPLGQARSRSRPVTRHPDAPQRQARPRRR